MKRQRIATITTNFRWGAVLVVVLFLIIQVISPALGQRGQQAKSQRPSRAPWNVDGATWTATGSLNTARYLHTATLLPNGMVLVAGGSDSSFTVSPSAEMYDPASGTWTVTGNLN